MGITLKIRDSAKADSKICLKCKLLKNIDDYHKNKAGFKKTHAVCKDCRGVQYQDKKQVKKDYVVYKMIDDTGNVIYVGATSDLKRRCMQHTVANKIDISFVKRVEFISLRSRIDSLIYEIYYINKYNPFYNNRTKETCEEMEIVLPEKVWKVFNL